MGFSRGNLDAISQGAKVPAAGLPGAQEQSQGCPWEVTAVEPQEAGERNKAIHLNLLQATELRVAGCGLHFFSQLLLHCSSSCSNRTAQPVSPGVTLDKSSEDHVSRCLFFSWLA